MPTSTRPQEAKASTTPRTTLSIIEELSCIVILYIHTCFGCSSQLYKALFGKYVNESMSVMYGIMGVAALLLRKGADIHTANRNGRSPYQILPFLGTLLTVLADFEDIM